MFRIFIPKFYSDFNCIADACPDTCCKDWDIVVDDETLEFYRSSGDEKLVNALKTDSDGDVILDFDSGVCPHLKDGLCSVQTKYGGDKLCETCRTFPRITQDYTVFEERLLTLACPEAARLMIIEEPDFGFLSEKREVSGDSGYDNEFMHFLLAAREMTAEIIKKDASFEKMSEELFAFTRDVQSLVDDEVFDITELLRLDRSDKRLPERDDVFDIHRDMDVMDKNYLTLIEACRNEKMPAEINGELKRLFLYYIARYYLTAVASYDIITTVIRAYCAAVVCGALISFTKAENDSAARAVIWQKYSKEIEHSDENEEIFRRLDI